MNSLFTHPQRILALAAGICVAAVGAALITQHVYDMQPCPWCILQRLIFIVIALVALATGRRDDTGPLRIELERSIDLAPKWQLLLRGQVGASAVGEFSSLPGSQRFFAGGDRSVRGFGQGEAQGRFGARDRADVAGADLSHLRIVASGAAAAPLCSPISNNAAASCSRAPSAARVIASRRTTWVATRRFISAIMLTCSWMPTGSIPAPTGLTASPRSPRHRAR